MQCADGFKVGAASAQLADVSGVTADGYRAAFLVSVAKAERVAATSLASPRPRALQLIITQWSSNHSRRSFRLVLTEGPAVRR